jgi:sulfur carrier protein
MNIIVNGSPRDVPDDLSAAALIGALGLGNKRLALEVNEAIVPRSSFDSYCLKPGDRVEIVHAIGGG